MRTPVKTTRPLAPALPAPALPALALPVIAALLLLSGCGSLTRLSEIGRPPAMSPTADPTADPNYRMISMPMPAPHAPPPFADSLWRPGSRAFFKDQRASQVGDIVTVLVNIADTAALQDKTTATRVGSQAVGIPDLLGLQASLPKLTAGTNPANLVSTNTNAALTGNGQIARNETITVRLAGTVTQRLPNGNLVVLAHQQLRVNSELRDLTVSGVVRPEDISSDNTVQHDRMAEARISYGGRGQLTYVQTPRYGEQVMDAILPF